MRDILRRHRDDREDAARPKPLPADLRQLESEAIGILREAAAEFRNPVLLYSIGKDSSVLLHLALKAFYPSKPPFPVLHIDTTWKFREMIAFRDATAQRLGLDLIVHTNQEGLDARHRPDRVGFGAAHPGDEDRGAEAGARPARLRRGLWRGAARRGEEPRQGADLLDPRRRAHRGTRARSGRNCGTCSTRGCGPANRCGCFRCRIGPSSMCGATSSTKASPVVPLYFAKERPVVKRGGTWIMVDDDRLPLEPGETPEMRRVRFRTLGLLPAERARSSWRRRPSPRSSPNCAPPTCPSGRAG